MLSWFSFGRRNPGAAGTPSASRTRDPVTEALSDREAQTVLREARAATRASIELGPQDAAALAARVSPRALALIVRHETGGRDHYERVYKSRPVWPEASSGVTIGFGYDLGYQTNLAAVAKDWSGVLPEKHIAMFEPAVGVAAAEPGRDDKVERIVSIVEELVEAGVTIPWKAAETVFQRVTVPRFAGITAAALPGHEKLPPDCFGALVSLTFNRGPSFDRPHDPAKDPKDRYREMRGIRQALSDGEIDSIPGLIRAMKRIWAGTAIAGEMSRRRENEARLFQDGIAHFAVAAADAKAAATVAEATSRVTRGGATVIEPIEDSDDDAEALEALEEQEQRTRGIDFTREVRRAAVRVGWASDDNAPDYAHLNNKLEHGIRFKLTAADLQYLADLNSFPVDSAGSLPILFGLRGCGIIEGHDGELSDEVLLRDQRPDHDTTRCVLGVWDRAAKKVAVFEGSTVPYKDHVAGWYHSQNMGNMLPTGLYGYIVGMHNGRPGCFVLRSAPEVKRKVMVRRSKNNMVYERSDVVTKSEAGDNLHPTFSSGPAPFGSAGCQVVRGNADSGGNHRGPWAKFRSQAGLKTASGKSGTPYIYMMLTGLEAMLAARARTDGATTVPEVRHSLMRLRFGSRSVKVARLQKHLGVPESGEFDVATAEKIYMLQKQRWDNASDGIFTPALDAELNAGVFTDLPADIVVAAQSPTQHPAQPQPLQPPAPVAPPAPGSTPVVVAAAAAPTLPVAGAQPQPAQAPAPVAPPAPTPLPTPESAPAVATAAAAAIAPIVTLSAATAAAQLPPVQAPAAAASAAPPPQPTPTAVPVLVAAASTLLAPMVAEPAPGVAAPAQAPPQAQILPIPGHLSPAQAAALNALAQQVVAEKSAAEAQSAPSRQATAAVIAALQDDDDDDDDLPTLADEDVLRGLPPEPDDLEAFASTIRRAAPRPPTEIVKLKIEQEDSRYYATDQNGDRCYAGKAMSYALQNARGLGLYDKRQLYDRFAEEQRTGVWAHFIWPSVMAESQGMQVVINTWDRAHFTWGFYQLAAHTADENLIVLFRELLKLPTAQYYFPDLTLHEGRVARITDNGPVTLERIVLDQRRKEKQIPDFMRYLNPSIEKVDTAEPINCAKFVHWAEHDPDMLATTTRVSIETMKKKLGRLDKMFGLTGRRPEIALWVSDMYHQGRGSKARVIEALQLSTLSDQLQALSRIDSTGNYSSRCDTVRRHVKTLLDEKRFEGLEFGRGPFSLTAAPIPTQPTPAAAPIVVSTAPAPAAPVAAQPALAVPVPQPQPAQAQPAQALAPVAQPAPAAEPTPVATPIVVQPAPTAVPQPVPVPAPIAQPAPVPQPTPVAAPAVVAAASTAPPPVAAQPAPGMVPTGAPPAPMPSPIRPVSGQLSPAQAAALTALAQQAVAETSAGTTPTDTQTPTPPKQS